MVTVRQYFGGMKLNDQISIHMEPFITSTPGLERSLGTPLTHDVARMESAIALANTAFVAAGSLFDLRIFWYWPPHASSNVLILSRFFHTEPVHPQGLCMLLLRLASRNRSTGVYPALARTRFELASSWPL